MEITLEQARALDAVARAGSFTRAATELKKGHTGVIYLIKTLEDRLGLKLLDRTGYRTQLTPTGRLIWDECQKVLEAEGQLLRVCRELVMGWEPYLTVVFDGIISMENGLRVISDFARDKIPTRVSLFSEYLGGVEQKFRSERADLMVSVMTPERSELVGVNLPPLRALLVAGKKHPLVQSRRKVTEEDLQQHVLLTVRGSDERLNLSTRGLDRGSMVHLGDFVAKKMGILAGLGFGWLPEYLIHKELGRGDLKVVRWTSTSEHIHYPRIFHRGERFLGRAAKRFLDKLVEANQPIS